ncbi:TspO and MBR like protein [Galdieria sulphuraria]|uniref:TspO and MBR like protein n=1 Tax=Galdieria sulphuraria TaxID=130081 RepID=M2Y7W1_GALSU|nr:TspO and MBR like protein [Galdieria sulphuraria]EME32168.1 TspO and MBR like protein [Galdieria sulphuraria]|eukprot:XP_005708688.1 TspO and MBR like protein [Galdieria sulphuraria]
MVPSSTLRTLGFQRSSLVCVDTWKPSITVSLLLWSGTIYGSSFILHLPSLWRKRVQLSHPFVPLDPCWYENLRKPKWTPPSAFFAITWIFLKALQSYAFALLWEASGRTPFSSVILYKVCYLVLSDLFNQVFFVQHDIFGAFVILLCMIGVLIVILMESFRRP